MENEEIRNEVNKAKTEEDEQKIKVALNNFMNYERDYIDLIEVNWIDAHSILDTVILKEARQEKLVNVISIGYLIDEDDNSIKICSFIFPDMEHDIKDPTGRTGFRDVHIIPKKMIKSILSLKIDFEESKKWREKE